MKASLEEEGEAVLKAIGESFKEAWDDHRYLYRHKNKKSIVLGHYFKLEEGWENEDELFERVQDAFNPCFSVGSKEANGFFFYLGVGNYVDFLNRLLRNEKINYCAGFRHGTVYLYGRKDLKLYKRLMERKNRNGREPV